VHTLSAEYRGIDPWLDQTKGYATG
jgi:hypothetical protein